MMRAVLFDLDRTLLDRDASMLSFASSQFNRLRLRLDGTDHDAFVAAFIRLDARGALWKDAVYQRLVTELGIRSTGWEELYQDFIDRIADHYVPFPHLAGTLAELSKHYLLGLITNGRTFFQHRTIQTLGIDSYFSAVLVSEAEEVRKPDPEIFLRALRRLEVPPPEAVYIGDHPVADIQGARNAGLHAIWKRNDDFPEFSWNPSFNDLAELPAMLRTLG